MSHHWVVSADFSFNHVCNLVIWVLVIEGTDFIRNFEEQKKKKKVKRKPAAGLKLSAAITVALKQIPSRSNTAHPSPVWVPSPIHALVCSAHADLMISSSCVIFPQGLFFSLPHKERLSLYPVPAPYPNKQRCWHKQTAAISHEAHVNERRINHCVTFRVGRVGVVKQNSSLDPPPLHHPVCGVEGRSYSTMNDCSHQQIRFAWSHFLPVIMCSLLQPLTPESSATLTHGTWLMLSSVRFYLYTHPPNWFSVWVWKRASALCVLAQSTRERNVYYAVG